MAELGETSDFRALVPGDPAGVDKTAGSMTVYADLLCETGEGLRRIDTREGWSGEAAEQFRATFDGIPQDWLRAGDGFHAASAALRRYAGTLRWAQEQATEAIRLWNEAEAATRSAAADHERVATQSALAASANGSPDTSGAAFVDPGEATRQAAQDTLDRARSQLAEAGEVAADTVGQTRDHAPEKPNLAQQAGSALGSALDAANDAGAHAINALASFGNAALNHPASVAAAAAGAGLTAVSATGEAAGTLLDATGVGALAGAPVNVVSAAGMATGVGITGAAMANMASQASGDDEVEVVDTDETSADHPAEAPQEISGMTKHGEEQTQGRDGHGVSDEAIHDAVDNPVSTPKEQPGEKFKYTGNDAIVVLNKDGKVITTWARGSRGWRHP